MAANTINCPSEVQALGDFSESALDGQAAVSVLATRARKNFFTIISLAFGYTF